MNAAYGRHSGTRPVSRFQCCASADRWSRSQRRSACHRFPAEHVLPHKSRRLEALFNGSKRILHDVAVLAFRGLTSGANDEPRQFWRS